MWPLAAVISVELEAIEEHKIMDSEVIQTVEQSTKTCATHMDFYVWWMEEEFT